ncbi:LmeA family phospholipid-binding protein [Longispora urticae]
MPKWAKVVVIVVVILGIALVAADRVLAMVAENVLADKVAEQLKSRDITATGKPDATIEGFPFLTQAAGGEFDAVEVHAAGLKSQGVALTDLTVRATGVKADVSALASGTGEVTAAKVTGTGTVPYSSIAGLLQHADLTITAENGKLKLRTPFRVAGQTFRVVATGTVALENGRVRLTVTDFQADGGALPPGAQALLRALASKLSQDIALPTLPYDLKLEKIETGNEGLTVHASALNVPLSG